MLFGIWKSLTKHFVSIFPLLAQIYLPISVRSTDKNVTKSVFPLSYVSGYMYLCMRGKWKWKCCWVYVCTSDIEEI